LLQPATQQLFIHSTHYTFTAQICCPNPRISVWRIR